VRALFNNDFDISPSSFKRTVRAFDPFKEVARRDLPYVQQPPPRRNEQTVLFCHKLGVRDPLDVILNGQWPEVPAEVPEAPVDDVPPSAFPAEEDFPQASVPSSSNEIELPDDSDDEETPRETTNGAEKCELSASESIVVDTQPSKEVISSSWSEGQPQKKKLKRRNANIYAEQPE